MGGQRSDCQDAWTGLVALARRAELDWRALTCADRRERLEAYALVEILIIPQQVDPDRLAACPRSVATRIVLDHGCREEAARRGLTSSSVAAASDNAKELQDFRSALQRALDAIEDWERFVAGG